MIVGAVRITAAAHPETQPDPCTDPFTGLINRKDQPYPTNSQTLSSGHSNALPTPSTTSETSSPIPPNENDSPQTTTSSSTPTTTPSDTDSDQQPEHTSWWPKDLTNALNGQQEPPPVILTRNDGRSAFYAGRVNGVIGPSESGKTWVVIHGAHQTIDRGGRVTVLDFEDSDTGVIGRLLKLGVNPDTIRDHVAYIGPDERYNNLLPTGQDLADHLATWQPELIIIDGFNAAMSLQGLNLLDNMEATLFFQQLLKPLAQTGAAVVYVDHTPKDRENGTAGGIGAQAKRAMTTGCTIKVDVIKAFGKGQSGKLRLYVDKDRQGDVRGVSAPNKTGHWFGDFDVTGHDDGTLDLAVNAPEGLDATHADTYEWRPTGYMERVSDWLQDNPGAGRNDILTGVSGKREHIKAALKILVSEGWINVTRDGQKHPHTIVKPYSEAAELAGEHPEPPTGVPGVPTGDPLGSGTPVEQLGSPGSTGVTTDPSGPGPQAYATDDPTEVPFDELAFCKHCGTDITEDLRITPALVKCRHCRHHINGSEQP